MNTWENGVLREATADEEARLRAQEAIDSAPRPITVGQVKAEAGRRLSATDWYVIRASEGGSAIPEAVLAERAAIRTRSNEIEAMVPIPADFASDQHWPS